MSLDREMLEKIVAAINEYLDREEQEETHPPPPEVEDEYVGNEHWRMSIAVDGRGQPHIVCDSGGEPVNYFFDRIDNDWIPSRYDSGGSTQQSYNPYIRINDKNQMFISIVKWYSDGMGLMARLDAAFEPTDVIAYMPTQGGMPAGSLPVGLCDIEPGTENEVIVYAGNGGFWEQYKLEGQRLIPIASGMLSCGRGGEKNGFDIAKTGVWHVCSDWSYNNNSRDFGAINWLDVDTYIDWIGHDQCYPTVIGDSSERDTAYLLTDLTQFGGPGLMYQIYRNGQFVAPLNELLNLDPEGTSGSMRYPPQACASNRTGIYVAYQAGHNTKVQYIEPDGTTFFIKEFAGSRPTITVDADEKLHICYIKDGIRYRKIDGHDFGDGDGNGC